MITKHMDDNSRSCGFIQPVTQEKYAKQLRKDRLSICTIRKISLGGTTKQSRFIALILILSIMLTLIPPIPRSNAATGADLTVGKYIYFGYYDIDKNDSKDEDERILWRVIHRDGNNVLLLTDKIIMLKAFDGKDASQVDADRKNNGSNNWADSNLRLWLNSTSQSMDDNSYGGSNEAPNNANVWTNYNEYSTEDGFLSDTNFTVDERSVIVPVNNKYVIDTAVDTAEGNGGTEHSYTADQPDVAVVGYDTSAYQTVQGQLGEYDKVFVLSIKEIADYVDGNTTLDINGNYHIATTTSDARTYSEYDMSTNTGAWYYWTRDAYTSYSYLVRGAREDGAVISHYAYHGNIGVRPALWLDTAGLTLSGTGEAGTDEAYTVTSYPDPTPPNAPTINITSPEGFTGNTNQDVTFTITDNGDNAGGSGVDKNQYSYDNDSWTDYATPVTLTTEGSRTIYARTLDVAGNISANTTRTVNIDRTPPVAPTVNIGTGTYGAAQNVIVTAAGDAASTYYTLDGTEPDNTDTLVASGGTITVDGNNGQTVTLKVVSYDAAGNKGSILTRQYTFEKTTATITVNFLERIASTDNITATITVDNAESWGYKWTNSKIKPTNGWTTVEPVTQTGNGVWYLHIQAFTSDEQETYVVKGPFIKGNIPVTEGYEIGTAPTDRKNFKYYIGKDKNGITKAMLVSITTKDKNFDRDDILDEQNKYRDGIYYIDRDGKIKQYSAN